MLAEKGILTAEDLLYHFPFRYEDRQNPVTLDELKPGDVASVIGEVRGSALLRTRRMPLFELTVGQGRHALKCVWFNAPYLNGKFLAGKRSRSTAKSSRRAPPATSILSVIWFIVDGGIARAAVADGALH